MMGWMMRWREAWMRGWRRPLVCEGKWRKHCDHYHRQEIGVLPGSWCQEPRGLTVLRCCHCGRERKTSQDIDYSY